MDGEKRFDDTGETTFTRRAIVTGLLLIPAGCAAPGVSTFDSGGIYGTIVDGENRIPAIDTSRRDPELARRQVVFKRPFRPGTIVVSIPERRLYLVQPGGTAMRYAVGVGRAEALNFRGSATIGRKAEWPTWTPTANMIRNIPKYAKHAGGMPGGINNPLGARALYLYRGSTDSHFRIHGTTEPETIGTAVSSGCIRLVNHDIIDLYNRVPKGAAVVVQQS